MNAFEQSRDGAQACAICGEALARLKTEQMSFEYGKPGASVTLAAQIPVWVCDACGASYTAEGAEEAERAAICAHLGRLTPPDIVKLRKSAGLTQEAFSAELGVGRVTLARWETGQQMQSEVYDRLIRELASRRETAAAAAARSRPSFRTDVEHRRPAARMFELVPA